MSLLKFLGKTSAVGPLMKFMNDDPSRKAMPYLNQINQMGQSTYNPYIQQGQEAMGHLQPLYEAMLNAPQFYNQIMGGYQQSPAYQTKRDEMMRAAGNTAAAGGFRGTGYDQRQQSEMIQSLLNNDMQDYLSNILGIQGAGMQGYEGMANRGFQGSNALADLLGSNYGQQAGLAFQGARQKHQNWMDLAGLGAQAFGAYSGAGAMKGLTGALNGLQRGQQSSYVPGAFGG